MLGHIQLLLGNTECNTERTESNIKLSVLDIERLEVYISKDTTIRFSQELL